MFNALSTRTAHRSPRQGGTVGGPRRGGRLSGVPAYHLATGWCVSASPQGAPSRDERRRCGSRSAGGSAGTGWRVLGVASVPLLGAVVV